MKTLKKLVIGITFSAVLAATLLGTGSDAYAKTRAPGAPGQANGSGPTTAPATGGTFIAFGISWE